MGARTSNRVVLDRSRRDFVHRLDGHDGVETGERRTQWLGRLDGTDERGNGQRCRRLEADDPAVLEDRDAGGGGQAELDGVGDEK